MSQPLDFIVIGAQKAGTTSLWQYLRGHPRIFMSRTKEAPFFIEPGADSPGRLEAYMAVRFADAPSGALLGKATPDYMLGRGDIGVEAVARRIADALPEVKLIVLLRDPVERAVSNHTMELRRGHESRSLDAALAEEVTVESLAAARRHPTFTNSYVIQGEYGRILDVYRSHFPAERILVEQSHALAGAPGEALDRVLTFLGLPTGYRPEDLGVRYFQGGMRSRIDPEARASLLDYLRREVLPHMEGDRAMHANAFGFFFTTWNVVPDEEPPRVNPDIRRRLEAHYSEDAKRLAGLGIQAPWIADWARSS